MFYWFLLVWCLCGIGSAMFHVYAINVTLRDGIITDDEHKLLARLTPWLLAGGILSAGWTVVSLLEAYFYGDE